MSDGRVVFGTALASVTVTFCAFLAGVVDILDASDGMRVFWQVVFVVAGLVVVGTMAAAVVSLVTRRHGVISVATLLVPVIPLALIAIVGSVG